MLTKLMVLPVLAVLQILDLFSAQQNGEPVQNWSEGVVVLQNVQRIVRLWLSHWPIDMYSLAVV